MKSYSYDLVETAIALFSAFDDYTLNARQDLPRNHPGRPSEISARNAREALGAAASRAICIELADICEKTWLAIPEDERDALTWDWEFCPEFILYCVNWHDTAETLAADPADLVQRWRDALAAHEAYSKGASA